MKVDPKQALYVLYVLIATPVAAEVVVRLAQPRPRVQVIRFARSDLEGEVVDGVPLWRQPADGDGRVNPRCLEEKPGAFQVVLAGSSIFYGSGLENEDSISYLLERKLEEERGPTCVINLSAPAYHFDQQQMEVRRYLADHQPDLLVFEVWIGTGFRYAVVGDAVYDFRGATLDENGLPVALLSGTSPALHSLLFRYSRLYEYAVLGAMDVDTQSPGGWEGFADERFTPFLDSLDGLSTIVVGCPWLNEPFDEQYKPDGTTIDPRGYTPYRDLRPAVRSRGIPWLELGPALMARQARVEDIRLDPCCHYNPDGSVVVADVLADAIQQGAE